MFILWWTLNISGYILFCQCLAEVVGSNVHSKFYCFSTWLKRYSQVQVFYSPCGSQSIIIKGKHLVLTKAPLCDTY